jgi:hypothetical protein
MCVESVLGVIITDERKFILCSPDYLKLFPSCPVELHVGEFSKTRHPRNVEFNKVLEACFSGAVNSRLSGSWNL